MAQLSYREAVAAGPHAGDACPERRDRTLGRVEVQGERFAILDLLVDVELPVDRFHEHVLWRQRSELDLNRHVERPAYFELLVGVRVNREDRDLVP